MDQEWCATDRYGKGIDQENKRIEVIIMKELLEVIAKSLVTNPDLVSVNEIIDGDNIVLELSVGEDDMGKVIGRQGRIAKAIRAVMKAAALKENKKVSVEIL